MSKSLDHFIRDAMLEHDGGNPLGAPTVIARKVRRQPMAGTLPDHDVGELLARGGMGAVYRATQRVLEREVAVKVMAAPTMGAEMADRFRREALVLGRLEHPNIVPIHDMGVDEDGMPFYTMKLVRGRTLQAILNDLSEEPRGVISEDALNRLMEVFRKVCDAIAFAHSKGILHRDLKPENIMVGEFGEVLVMDWGLAKSIGQGEGQSGSTTEEGSLPGGVSLATLQGAVMGTPQYMSPEQAQGRIDELDERSDVYALGAILYTILTLRPPVEGSTSAEVLEKVVGGKITPPSSRLAEAAPRGELVVAKASGLLPHLPNGRVPGPLSAVAMKALQLRQEDRYADVAGLIDDIDKWQGGFATGAEAAGLRTQVLLLIKRHKTLFATITAAWALITLFGMVFVVQLRAKEQRALAGESAAKESAAVALRQKDLAEAAQAQSALSLAEALRRDQNGPAMQASLATVPPKHRDSTWRYLQQQADSADGKLGEWAGVITGVAARPTLPHEFVCGDANGTVRIVDAESGAVRLELLRGAGSAGGSLRTKVACTSDGEVLAVGGGMARAGIAIFSAMDGRLLREWSCKKTHALEFSADGSTLLQCCGLDEQGRRGFSLWEVATGREIWFQDFPQEPGKYGLSGTFFPGGEQVYVSSDNESKSFLLSSADGRVLKKLPWGSTAPPAISRDGRHVITGNLNGVVTIYDVASGQPLLQRATHGGRISAIVFMPGDGRFASAAVMQDGRQVIELRDAQNGSLKHQYLGGHAGHFRGAGASAQRGSAGGR